MAEAEVDYDVALSFAGEDRAYVEQVAASLRAASVRVFYDGYEEVDLWGKNLYDHLAEVYAKRAHLCVMFISRAYAEKVWTNHERQHAQARALSEHEEYILPARFDDTPILGLASTVGYVSLRERSPADFARLVLSKLATRRGHAQGRYAGLSNDWIVRIDDEGRLTTTTEELSVTFAEMRLGSARGELVLEMPKDLLINAVRLDDVLNELLNFEAFYASFSTSVDLRSLLRDWTGSTGGHERRAQRVDLARFAEMIAPFETSVSRSLRFLHESLGLVPALSTVDDVADAAGSLIEYFVARWRRKWSPKGRKMDVWWTASPDISFAVYLDADESSALADAVGGEDFLHFPGWTALELTECVIRRKFTPALLYQIMSKHAELSNAAIVDLFSLREWSIGVG